MPVFGKEPPFAEVPPTLLEAIVTGVKLSLNSRFPECSLRVCHFAISWLGRLVKSAHPTELLSVQAIPWASPNGMTLGLSRKLTKIKVP